MFLWASFCRLARIVTVITRQVASQLFVALMARCPRFAFRPTFVRLSGPERLRMLLEDLGGTFIKFGQMLALQPDTLSLEYCNALFSLLDRVAPFSFEHVEHTFIKEFGRLPSEIFDSIEANPIATGSIGQVHLVYFNGRKLAVKVQRPNAEAEFAGDIQLMTAAIRIIKFLRLKSLFWVVEPMSEFVAWTHEELDYRCEARYMEQLRTNAHDNPRERVPEVFWDYTTRRILTIEFFEGVTVLDYLRAMEEDDELLMHRLRATGFDANEFASNIIDNFLSDTFRQGMFHADLHPANLMILPGNVVGYLDFGITAVLSHYSRRNLLTLTLALVRGDLEGMCGPFFNVSTQGPDTNIEGFHEGLKRLEDKWYETKGNDRLMRVNITVVMLDMLKLSRKTGVWPERGVVKYVRSAIAADGLITRFAPGFSLDKHLEAICERYLRWHARQALFSYDTLVNWSSSSSHLIRDGVFRASGLLQRISAGELPARIELNMVGQGTDGTSRVRAMQLAAVVFALSILISITGERMQFGVNLFTAEIALLVVGAMALLRNIRALA
jgi:ubiquinone biosynthesis protein